MDASRSGLGGVLRRLLMRPATVAANEPIAGRFHLITLEGPALRDAAWTPGQKVQIAMGASFLTRTYTPLDWDAVAGRFRILGYAHGDGPGSAWIRDAGPGAVCDVFGPRDSIDPRAASASLALFGDETSIGLAHALAAGRRATHHFELDDPQSGGAVLEHLGFAHATLFERRATDVHVDRMEVALAPLAVAGAAFVLTGKAGTVQRLRQALKLLGVPSSRISTKAYWAPGKTGLD
ncbi:siderophore-interacting protein [Caulobacter segnis]|uniref:siderophore-interacting protein n=1 Tax=Caulobacter segnis TaxID=88688 RepID=UPI00285B9699|nr:siderophore-interacting protein [Caulobacter segnis]MDR6625611.1 NADPH-dependent ferric siderophore reductase [Caulobacter segnis]